MSNGKFESSPAWTGVAGIWNSIGRLFVIYPGLFEDAFLAVWAVI